MTIRRPTERDMPQALRELMASDPQVKAYIDAVSFRDTLGLFNRRYFETHLEGRMNESIRYKQPMGLVEVDIDHFKGINDVYGHPFGDKVILYVGIHLGSMRGGGDTVCRLGGEEYGIILPQTDLDGAMSFAEVKRLSVENMDIFGEIERERDAKRSVGKDYDKEQLLLDDVALKPVPKVTISLGVGERMSIGTSSPATLMHDVDKALYLAKKSGRNCVRSIRDW